MNIKHATENWDYTHYLVYMYVVIANSDYEVTAIQLDELHRKLAHHIFGEDSSEQMYDEVMKIYKHQNDIQVFNCIESLSKKYITNEEQKQKVLKDIHDIMESDGHESGSEHIMFMSIKKVLNSII